MYRIIYIPICDLALECLQLKEKDRKILTLNPNRKINKEQKMRHQPIAANYADHWFM